MKREPDWIRKTEKSLSTAEIGPLRNKRNFSATSPPPGGNPAALRLICLHTSLLGSERAAVGEQGLAGSTLPAAAA